MAGSRICRELAGLKRLAGDKGFQEAFLTVKRNAKTRFADWLKTATGEVVDPDTIFDCQIKRIHEYKRQLLNALHIVVLYNRLRANPGLEFAPRTFFFAGKAAAAYALAKVIVKFINNLASTVNADPAVNRRLKVLFVPDYCVSVAERLIPAGDVSEQISTAGYEASGTSNMKFMMNGALTIGTLDGATVQIAEEVVNQNLSLFGLPPNRSLTAASRTTLIGTTSINPNPRGAVAIFSKYFNCHEPHLPAHSPRPADARRPSHAPRRSQVYSEAHHR